MTTWFAALVIPAKEAKPKRPRQPREWMDDAKKLAVGESILVPYTPGSIAANVRRATGGLYKTHKEGDQLRLTRIA